MISPIKIYTRVSIARFYFYVNESRRIFSFIHIKAEASNIYSCLVSELDNCIKLNLIRIT